MAITKGVFVKRGGGGGGMSSTMVHRMFLINVKSLKSKPFDEGEG